MVKKQEEKEIDRGKNVIENIDKEIEKIDKVIERIHNWWKRYIDKVIEKIDKEREKIERSKTKRELNEDASHERLTKPEVVFYWWFSLNPVTSPLLRLILKSFNFG